jgi:hypothetical protein
VRTERELFADAILFESGRSTQTTSTDAIGMSKSVTSAMPRCIDDVLFSYFIEPRIECGQSCSD